MTFSWPWFFATILGTIIGFVAGEMIESLVTQLRKRSAKKRERLPLKMQEKNVA